MCILPGLQECLLHAGHDFESCKMLDNSIRSRLASALCSKQKPLGETVRGFQHTVGRISPQYVSCYEEGGGPLLELWLPLLFNSDSPE